MKKYLLLLIAMLTMSVASAKDVQTVTFRVDEMKCVNCEAKVKNNISYVKGVKKLVTDVAHKTVSVNFDAEKTSVADLQAAFKKFGYSAEVVYGPTKIGKKKVDATTGATTHTK